MQCTFFCLDCPRGRPLCLHCTGSQHRGHTVLQVRRYVYCDVVRTSVSPAFSSAGTHPARHLLVCRCLPPVTPRRPTDAGTCSYAQDIQRYVDISGIQTYIVNGARVIFLHSKQQQQQQQGAHHHHQQQPQQGGGGSLPPLVLPPSSALPPLSGSHGSLTNRCCCCQCGIRDGADYCSLACKVRYIGTSCAPQPAHHPVQQPQTLQQRMAGFALATSPTGPAFSVTPPSSAPMVVIPSWYSPPPLGTGGMTAIAALIQQQDGQLPPAQQQQQQADGPNRPSNSSGEDETFALRLPQWDTDRE